MVPSKENFNFQADSKGLSQLVDNLTPDNQRFLSRLLNDWEKRDQRQNPRTPCSIITEYTVNSQAHKGTMQNISLDGAYIASRDVFPVNQEIFQSFFFPNFEIPIRSNSKIIWTGSTGFGVRFEFVEGDK